MSLDSLNEEDRVLILLYRGEALTQERALRDGIAGHRLAATVGRIRKKQNRPIVGTGRDGDGYRLEGTVSEDEPLPLFEPDGWVYFAEAVGAGRVKIGWSSRDPEERMADFYTGSPFPLVIRHRFHGSKRDEEGLHARFQRHRVGADGVGREWFHFAEEIRRFIAGGP